MTDNFSPKFPSFEDFEDWDNEPPADTAGYSVFAQFYDALTANVDYPRRGEYFHSLLQRFFPGATQVLDLACGTGSLSYELHRLGYQVIGVDASPEMLMEAMAKKEEQDILFLQQSMQELTLHQPVEAVISALDSINHLATPQQVKSTFAGVSKALVPGGVFLFDVNTLYKHKEILNTNAFVYETEDVFCVWQNQYQPQDHSVEIWLDFFLWQGEELYQRSQESFCEHYYSQEQLTDWLAQAGFELLAVYHEDSCKAPEATSQRLVYAAKKKQ